MAKRAMIILIFSFLLILSYLFPHKFWAFSAITTYPIWAQVIFWGLIVSLFFKKTSVFIEKIVSDLADFLYAKRRKAAPYIVAVFAAIILIIAWNNHLFWGDTGECLQFVSDFPRKIDIHNKDYLTTAVYKLFCTVFFFLPVKKALSLFIILLSTIFSVLIYKISDNLFKHNDDKLTFFMLFLSSSTFLIFNHIEYYPLPLLLVTISFYFITKDVKKDVNLKALTFAAIAALFHRLIAYIFLILVIFWVIRRKKQNQFDVLSFLFVISPILIILMVGLTPYSKFFLMFKKPRYFFSADHLIMIVNYILFSSPLIYYIFVRKKENTSQSSLIIEKLSIYLSLSAVILICLLYFTIGGADWDVASFLLFPLSLTVPYIITKKENSNLKYTLAGLALIIFFINVFVGSSRTQELKFVENAFLDKKVPYLIKKFPSEERICFLGHVQYIQYGDKYVKNFTVKHCENAIKKYPKDDRAYLYLSAIYRKDGDTKTAIKILNDAISKAKSGYRAMEKLSDIYQKLGKKKKAIELLMNAPEVPESTALRIERPDERTLGEMILLIKQALNEMTSGGKAAVFKSKSGYYFSVR